MRRRQAAGQGVHGFCCELQFVEEHLLHWLQQCCVQRSEERRADATETHTMRTCCVGGRAAPPRGGGSVKRVA